MSVKNSDWGAVRFREKATLCVIDKGISRAYRRKKIINALEAAHHIGQRSIGSAFVQAVNARVAFVSGDSQGLFEVAEGPHRSVQFH